MTTILITTASVISSSFIILQDCHRNNWTLPCFYRPPRDKEAIYWLILKDSKDKIQGPSGLNTHWIFKEVEGKP